MVSMIVDMCEPYLSLLLFEPVTTPGEQYSLQNQKNALLAHYVLLDEPTTHFPSFSWDEV